VGRADADGTLFSVDVRNRVDLGEGVADVAQGGGDRVGGEFQQAARKCLAGLDEHHFLQCFFGQNGVARELDLRHRIFFTLGQPGGDEDVLLVRADRDLGAVGGEVDIAAVEIERIEFFKIARKFLARVLIVATVETQQVAFLGFPAVGDFLLLEFFITDQVDVADLGRLAFLDMDGDVHAIAVEFCDGGNDLDVVLAAVVVLTSQFLGDSIQAEAIESVAFGQADVLQALG
jgi:hypothetical protein